MTEWGNDREVQKELERLYEEWMHAATIHDDEWYARNLADEFRYLSGGGGIASREEMIAIANKSEASQ